MAENHDPIIADGEGPEVAEETAGASAEGGCPVVHGRVHPTQGDANSQWWPNRLNLKILAKNAGRRPTRITGNSTTRRRSRPSTSRP